MRIQALQFQQIRWPTSEVHEAPGTNYSTVHCYTELNSSFVGRTARLIAEKQLTTRSCMIRIPTHTRLYISPQGYRSGKVGVEISVLYLIPHLYLQTYVWIIAGSSYTSMPLRTPKLFSTGTSSPHSESHTNHHTHNHQQHRHRADINQWGPWHVPCSHAYLVFHADDASNEEYVDIRFAPETRLDVDDARRSDCAAEGRNYAMADI